jgi:GH15 family glucan-1,4-alpha-glucosidase
MGRSVVLSNGELFVGIDEQGLVHDFYYPYVGLENLTNARNSRHKIGVWANGVFSWTDDGSWEIAVDFESDALISHIAMRSSKLGVQLELRDFVDQEQNAFIRSIEVKNLGNDLQEIRLFMHQVFQISRAGRADTAFYVPEGQYIFDYKGRCCLLISGKIRSEDFFDQFAIGNYAIEGKAGTFVDAEDGVLSGNAVEHGGVDSVIRFAKTVEPGESFIVDYWVAAATSQTDAQRMHQKLIDQPMAECREKASQSFRAWLKPALETLHNLDETQRIATQKSLLVIKAHCDKRGSVLASGDSSIFNYGRDYYCYCWPRDAAYAVWPLIRLGIFEEARRLFVFMRDTMHKNGYLMHKYQPDRAIGSTWHPLLHGKNTELAIQEDETAIMLFMMGEYYRYSKDKEFLLEFYDSFVLPCATFLATFVDKATGLPHASYDLWEQKFLTSTYSVATVIAGLTAAEHMAEALDRDEDAQRWQSAAFSIRLYLDALYHPDGYFRKGFLLDGENLRFDDTLDISSLYGAYMFAELDINDERLKTTAEQVEKQLFLRSPIGGVIRYEGDGYFLSKQNYGGNPWIVCTLWLAQYYVGVGQLEKSKELIQWALDRALPSGVLSEQFDPEDGSPLSVTPLVWSHAELINTILDVLESE